MSALKSLFAVSSLVVVAGCVLPGAKRPPTDVPVDGGGVPVSRRVPLADDCDNVVPIIARNTGEGIAKEDGWIARNHPGAQTIGRRRTQCNGQVAEVITLRDSNGLDFNVTFDISSFFGKTSSGDNLEDLLDG